MNIILIGFMGAGKTTVGKYLANQSDLDFIDTDELIEQHASMSIKDIFRNYGEDYFRILERDTIAELEKLQNTVISIGGGAVMFHNNLEKLKKIGIVMFLNTPIEKIFLNLEGVFRPLIGETLDKGKILALYKSRLDTYMQADIIIDTNNSSLNEVSKLIMTKAEILNRK